MVHTVHRRRDFRPMREEEERSTAISPSFFGFSVFKVAKISFFRGVEKPAASGAT